MKNITINKTEWDIEQFLDKNKSFEEKRKEWRETAERFVFKWKKRKDYLKDPRIMKEVLDEYEKFHRFFGFSSEELFYFKLKKMQNQNDSEIKARFNNVQEFRKNITNELRFFTLSLGKINKNQQKIFLEAKELSAYTHFLEKIFKNSKYRLSEKEEKIMNLKSDSAYSSWVKMVSGLLVKEEREITDEDGKQTKKTFSELIGLLTSQNKKVRDECAKKFNEILEKYVDIAEAEINAILADKKVNDELRGRKRPDLARHLSDDIDSEIVDALVQTVSKRFDISRRYYKLKAKLLGVKKLEYHERNIEYNQIEKKYTYEESVNLVHEVFSNLDEKFKIIFEKFIKNNQIDVYPKKDKKNGACCIDNLIIQPTYILLNYTNKLHDVLTLAHEMGHGINSELMKEKQNSLNFDSPLSTAEVASTFMEDFVLDKLIKNVDEETKLAIMMQKLNEEISTIMRQIACYMFEQELHKNFRKKGYLSKEEIGKLFQKHMSNYMGEFVEQSPGSENWWVFWSHIREFFYNYSYASGLLISKAMQREVKKDPKFLEKIKDFLSAGESDSPKNIFSKLGIDITDKTFWEKGLDEVDNLLIETEKLAKKLVPESF